MDKYEVVIKILDNPEKFSKEELEEILSDKETREIYNLLCKINSSFSSQPEPDVNREWKIVKRKKFFNHIKFSLYRNRVAIIFLILMTSIIAVVAAISFSVYNPMETPEQTNTILAETPISASLNYDTTPTQDSILTNTEPIIFEDMPLSDILNYISIRYNVRIDIKNPTMADLRLYYKITPNLSLDEVIDQLNTFEQINIQRNDTILNVF